MAILSGIWAFSKVSMSLLTSFFHIRSADRETQQKGHVVQGLVLFLTLVALLRWGGLILAASFAGQTLTTILAEIPKIALALGIAFLCLGVTRRGYPVIAAHIFFIALDITFFTVLVSTNSPYTFPYLLVISIIAIAALDSVWVSMGYAGVIITAVSIYLLNYTQLGPGFAVSYAITALGISLVGWVTAYNFQAAVRSARVLTSELRQQTSLLQKRTTQLQRSAEVSQSSTSSLNLDELLADIVQTIQKQFEFYYVAIFLLDDSEQNMRLREATGLIGQILKSQQYQHPLHTQSLVSWVATHQKPRAIADVNQDTTYINEPLLAETKAELGLPLIARGQLVGVLNVHSTEINPFDEENTAVLQIMANQLAINIDNARLFAQAKAHLNETTILLNLNTLLTTTLDPGEIYRRASRTFTEQLHISRCSISSWEKAANTVTVQIEFIHDEENNIIDQYDLEIMSFDIAKYPITHHVLHQHQPHVRTLHDPQLDNAEKELLDVLKQYSCLELPMMRGNEAIGTVELFRTHKQPPFHPDEIQLAQAMANQTAIILHNASLATEMQARVAQLSSLNRLSTTLSTAPALKEMFSGVRREILSLVEATGISIVLLAPEGDKMNWVYGFEYGQEVDLSNIPPLPITQGFSGYVARTREVLLINKDIAELREKLQSFNVGAVPNAWLGVPLIAANKLIGVLAVENEYDTNAFNQRDAEMLKTFAGSIAIAINNFLQFEEIQKALAAQSEQRVQLQTAAEVAAAATGILNLNDLINRAVHLIKERFQLYYVGLFLKDEETHYAVLRAGTGEAGRVQLEQHHQLPVGGRSLIGGATSDGIPRITQDVRLDSEWRPNPYLPDTRSELALPLRVREETIGALTVQSTTPNAFSPELIGTLQTMCDQLAVAIRNAQLISEETSRAQRQRQLNQISTRLHRSVDVNEIVSIGLQALSRNLGGAKVALTLGRTNREDSEAGEHPSQN